MERWRAAVSGLTGLGWTLCEAIRANPTFDLVAVADRNRSLADRAGERFGSESFSDYRSVMIEPRPRVLFVAMPPFERSDYLKLAVEQGIAVLATAPPLPTLTDAWSATEFFAVAGVPFSVLRVWEPEPAYVRLRNIEMISGRLFSAHVNVISPVGNLQGWRGDSARAGGGVLLNDAYDQVDALVSIFGWPDEVLAVVPSTATAAEVRTWDTEDAATVLLRFPGSRVATLNCRRMGAHSYWRYRLHGTRATVVVTPKEMIVTDADGRQPSISRVRSPNCCAPAVNAFAASLAAGLSATLSPIDQHLMTLCVIQTAYLSARTGQPESPARLYRAETGQDP